MLRATFIFVSERASWTETHYATVVSTYALLAPLAAQLATLRAACQGFGSTLTTVRLSDTANPRTVVTVDQSLYFGGSPYDAVPPATIAGAAQVDADISNNSVLVRLTTTGVPKNLYLAGCPDGVIGLHGQGEDNLVIADNPAWVSAMKSYLGLPVPTSGCLTGGQWGCLAKFPAGPKAAVVANAAAPYSAFAAIQTSAPLVGVLGSRILLKGFRRVNPRQPGISGAYKILAVQSANIYVLAQTTSAMVANVQPLPGTAYDLAYGVLPYISAKVIKGGTRKRGGSTGAPRGRSPIRL